ncbi:MAG: metalloregulator ArsR/SmtB family transcription factor [Eubacteriales bacterium]
MEKFHCEAAKCAHLQIPDDVIATDLADFLKIFGDYTRIRLLFAIKESELCVHDLSLILNMRQPAVSHQLKILRHYKLVKVRREGRKSFYSLDDSHILGILEIGLSHITHS